MQKVLIIKVGYSETLDPEISTVTSYGDVLRSTVLLNLYKNDHVTWLVDEKAYPILRNNPCITRVLIYDLSSVLQLQAEHFDTVINLEKVPGLCALADQVRAWRLYGFRFDAKTGQAEAYDGTHDALSLCKNEQQKRNDSRYWQEHLFEMVGQQWRGEEYVFGYSPRSREQYDIGFNYMVGNKWPSKVWPTESWQQVESQLGKDYSISWQQGLNDMEQYFDWIHSCRLIVTNDSFGLHLAIAMKKKIVALFSSTGHRELCLYGQGTVVSAGNCLCSDYPCHQPQCRFSSKLCSPDPNEVERAIRRLLDHQDPAAELAERLVSIADRQRRSLDEIRQFSSTDFVSTPTVRE
jgi:heptosyltransferase II